MDGVTHSLTFGARKGGGMGCGLCGGVKGFKRVKKRMDSCLRRNDSVGRRGYNCI